VKPKKISEYYIEFELWSKMYESMMPNDLRGLNFNNIGSIEKVVREYLLPTLQKRNISRQIRTKESLRYAINFWNEKKFASVYNSGLYCTPQLRQNL